MTQMSDEFYVNLVWGKNGCGRKGVFSFSNFIGYPIMDKESFGYRKG